jgi:predicted metalloprotease with PDZ domain
VGFGPWATPGADWIIEGLAEFYSLQFLVRSGTISNERFISALASQEKWGRDVSDLCVQRSSGSVTARAVSVFVKLDAEIRAATNKRYSLDDLTRALAIEDTKISLDNLRSNVVNVMGKNSDTLASANLPGCGK